MNTPSVSPSLSAAPSAFTERTILRHLIRQEWRLCRGPVVLLAMIWTIGLWVLVIFHHPAWLIAIGLLHVILVSPTQAGHDISDGTEEFSFALPPGRSPLYLARLSMGLAFLISNGLLGWLAITCNLPQRLWSVFFSGGLTEPFAPVTNCHWYAMAVLLPCAAHAVTFAVAANAGSRATVNVSWLAGIAAAVSVMLVGLFLENLLWQAANGFLAGPALLVTTVLVLLGGHFAYLRKEATGSGGVAGRESSSGIGWIIAVIVGLLLCLALGLLFFRTANVETRSNEEMRRQHIQPIRAKPVPAPAATPERDQP
ncbi:MAG: hypothetical protein NTW21_35295 [Verrucomicrobia bacterium]|nr:hypothetical protein [Verrucomicrobiota bacterium]